MTQIEHKLPSGTMLIIPAPIEATRFQLTKENDFSMFLSMNESGKPLLRTDIELADWQLLGESTSLSEEMLSGIIPSSKYGLYENFNCKFIVSGYQFNEFSAIESFASLKQSLKIDESKRRIILFKTS